MVYYVICIPNVMRCNQMQVIFLFFCARLPTWIDFEGLHDPRAIHSYVSVEM